MRNLLSNSSAMEEREEKNIMADVNGYEVSADGKKILC
jgi:hypothetical protein